MPEASIRVWESGTQGELGYVGRYVGQLIDRWCVPWLMYSNIYSTTNRPYPTTTPSLNPHRSPFIPQQPPQHVFPCLRSDFILECP